MHKEGPLLVLAAPGSGKTSVICNRARYLIEVHKIAAERICILTFSKEAAEGMQRRLNQNPSYPVRLGTVHSLCYQILSQHSVFQSHKLITSEQRKELILRILQEQHQDQQWYQAGKDEVERASNEITRQASFLTSLCDPDELSIFSLYRKRKEELHLMDFDDLLIYALQILSTQEQTRLKWQTRFDYYMVDEFQDLNEIQFQILSILSQKHSNMMAVGDEDQSIYGFRGASPDIMEKFQENYPSCRRICLETNYRSTDSIIALSRKCIERNQGRITKEIHGTRKKEGETEFHMFTSQHEQTKFILDKINKYNQELINEKQISESQNLKESFHTAILFRTGRELKEFAGLVQNSVEEESTLYHQVRMDILQDLKHYIAVYYNQKNLSETLAIMNHPKRGLSAMYLPVEKFSLSAWEEFCRKCKATEQAEKVHDFRQQLQQMFRFQPVLGIRYLMEVCGYRNYIIENYGKSQSDKRKLTELCEKITKELDAGSWRTVDDKLNIELIKLKEEMENSKRMKMNNILKGTCLLTMHAAKGLEFQNVFLPNLNEGLFPSARSLQEGELEQERRLFYVAMTRAKQNLYLSCYGEEGKKKKSRFLSELGFS